MDAQQREVLTRREGRPVPPDVANGTVTRVRQLRVTNRDRYERHRDGRRLRLVCGESVCVGESRTGRNIGEAHEPKFESEFVAVQTIKVA